MFIDLDDNYSIVTAFSTVGIFDSGQDNQTDTFEIYEGYCSQFSHGYFRKLTEYHSELYTIEGDLRGFSFGDGRDFPETLYMERNLSHMYPYMTKRQDGWGF